MFYYIYVYKYLDNYFFKNQSKGLITDEYNVHSGSLWNNYESKEAMM